MRSSGGLWSWFGLVPFSSSRVRDSLAENCALDVGGDQISAAAGSARRDCSGVCCGVEVSVRFVITALFVGSRILRALSPCFLRAKDVVVENFCITGRVKNQVDRAIINELKLFMFVRETVKRKDEESEAKNDKNI